MQDHLKYLVVDDIQEWADRLKVAVEEYFVDEKRFAKARVRGRTAYNAAQADDQIADGGWDLVLLDMNLDEGSKRAGARGRISGLDLLGDIARGNRAYFVIIVTGAVTDTRLDSVYDPETAALLRFGAMNEAVKLMPASRVRILHKPEGKSVAASVEQLSPQLHSAMDQYCSVSMERNLFRALPGDPKLLEVCFNGGPRLTLRFEAPLKTIQSALAQPGRMLRVTDLIQRLAHSSIEGGPVIIEDEKQPVKTTQRDETEYRGHQEDEVSSEDGLDYSERDGFSVSDGVSGPVEMEDGPIPVETLIGGLLAAKKSGQDLAVTVQNIITGMGIDEAVLLAIPRSASEWARKGADADAKFSINNACEALVSLVRALKPVLEPIKERWLANKKAQKNEPNAVKKAKKGKGKKGVRVTLGEDTAEKELARQHWLRFKKIIKARPALKDFYIHMAGTKKDNGWIDRSPTARGHLYYRPPGGGEFYPFWNTQ